MRKKKIIPKGWYLSKYKNHDTFEVCQEKDPNKTYCLRIGSEAFTKAALHDLAPKIRKSIGVFIVHDTDDNFTVVTSDIPTNASLMPLVIKSISRLHRLGLSYEGRVYVDKRKKRVHFMRFRNRDDMSPLEWVLEQIKDFETLKVMHTTEYERKPELKWFMKKIDQMTHKIAEIL
jgi:hypothetical protein